MFQRLAFSRTAHRAYLYEASSSPAPAVVWTRVGGRRLRDPSDRAARPCPNPSKRTGAAPGRDARLRSGAQIHLVDRVGCGGTPSTLRPDLTRQREPRPVTLSRILPPAIVVAMLCLGGCSEQARSLKEEKPTTAQIERGRRERAEVEYRTHSPSRVRVRGRLVSASCHPVTSTAWNCTQRYDNGLLVVERIAWYQQAGLLGASVVSEQAR